MNIHVPEIIRNKWPTFEFIGHPWSRGGFTWMRAYHKTLNQTLKFCFELECGVEDREYEFICEKGYFG